MDDEGTEKADAVVGRRWGQTLRGGAGTGRGNAEIGWGREKMFGCGVEWAIKLCPTSLSS